jgi:hypothetical protein
MALFIARQAGRDSARAAAPRRKVTAKQKLKTPLQAGVLIEIFHLLTAPMRHFAGDGLGRYLVALKMNLDWDQSRV